MDFFNNSFRNQIILISLVVLAVLATVFTEHSSIFLVAVHWILITGILYFIISNYLSGQSNSDEETYEHIESKNVAPEEDHKNPRQMYAKWLESVENTILSMNKNFKVGIYFLNPESDLFILQNDSRQLFLKSIQDNHELLASIMASEKSLKYIENENRDSWEGLFEKKSWRGSESFLGSQILLHNVPQGCILVYSDHFSTFDNRDHQILASVCKSFELGLSNMEEVESLEMLHHYSQRIFNLYHSISHATPLDDVLKNFGDVCNQLFVYDAFTISLKMATEKNPVVYYSLGENSDAWQGLSFSVHDSVHGYSILTNEKMASRNWSHDFPDFTRFGKGNESSKDYQSVISVPISLHQHGKGSIVLEKKSKDGFTKTDLQLLELFAQTIGSILTWIYQYKSTHDDAVFDYLTGLLDRKAFLDRFKQEIQRAIRFQQNLVLLMLDLDKFKKINDTHGHLYGDYMLQTVSKLIQKSVRDIDVVGRYGGEEFIVILVNTSKQLAEQVGRRIIHSISTYNFEEHGVESRITISGGMAQFPSDSDEQRALIKLADEALYAAKNMGGNRVILHEETIKKNE